MQHKVGSAIEFAVFAIVRDRDNILMRVRTNRQMADADCLGGERVVPAILTIPDVEER